MPLSYFCVGDDLAPHRVMNINGELKWYLGEKDYAYLKYSETKTSFSLDIVSVPVKHRNQGIGSALIGHLLLLADSMQKEVYLSARPLGTFSEEKLDGLIAYYGKFGFEVFDRGLTVAYMRRKFRTDPITCR